MEKFIIKVIYIPINSSSNTPPTSRSSHNEMTSIISNRGSGLAGGALSEGEALHKRINNNPDRERFVYHNVSKNSSEDEDSRYWKKLIN